MAAGLKCSSGCAACWLDNNNDGEDTKFTCTGDEGVHCGDVCPTGHNGCRSLDASGVLNLVPRTSSLLVLHHDVACQWGHWLIFLQGMLGINQDQNKKYSEISSARKRG